MRSLPVLFILVGILMGFAGTARAFCSPSPFFGTVCNTGFVSRVPNPHDAYIYSRRNGYGTPQDLSWRNGFLGTTNFHGFNGGFVASPQESFCFLTRHGDVRCVRR
jgi:hypothetical protein